MALNPGTRLDGYEILSPLGAGGMGEVYRAKDTKLGREVALKILSEDLATNGEMRARFVREAQAVAALSHPNILSIFDFGQSGTVTYAVMELLEGETLRERLEGGRLPRRKAIEYAVQAAQGLAAAHEKGIVHRDVKPENLFITGDGRLKILDFGLARQVPALLATPETASPTVPKGTEPGSLMGTVGYMSPEQVRGQAADHRSDIFSLGAVLYEMLTGQRAFRRASAVETMNAILKEDPPEPQASGVVLSPNLERVIRRCLEKSPPERFQSARDLAFNLESLEGTTTSGAGQTALKPRIFPRRMLWAACLFLAGAAVAAVLVSRWRTPAKAGFPEFQQLTFRRGTLTGARFMPNAPTVVYSAAWGGGAPKLYVARPGTPESMAFDVEANLLSISRTGELAVLLHPRWWSGGDMGTLARYSMGQGAPRQVLDRAREADWMPDGENLLVTDVTQGILDRLEFPMGKEIPSDGEPLFNPRLSPKGDALAIARTNRVLLVDKAGKWTPLAETRGFGGLAWSPDGDEVWYADVDSAAGQTTLWAVDRSGKKRMVYRTEGLAFLSDLAPDGGALVAMSHSRGNVVALPPGSDKEHDLSWLNRTSVADLSRDGGTLLLNEGGLGARTSSYYLRKADGSPAIKLGEGRALALSPDGRFVLAEPADAVPEKATVSLVPTGPGERRTWTLDGFQGLDLAWFFPDGQRLLYGAVAPDGSIRLVASNLDGSGQRAVAQPAVQYYNGEHLLSPDGKWLAIIKGEAGQVEGFLVSVDGGTTEPLLGLGPQDIISGWSGDGRFLYLFRRDQVPAPVYKLDVKSGKRTLWREITPADPAGIRGIPIIRISSDERAYAYQFVRTLDDLYLIRGLK